MSYVKNYHVEHQFTTAERCTINELLNHSDDNSCSIAKASVAPGISTQLHAVKNTIERYIILEGEGEVCINYGTEEQVKPLDAVTIPAGVAQKITNTGNKDLVFLCICTPRFEQKNYQKLESGYQVVSCEMHSELELAIMHGKQLSIHYNNGMDKQPITKIIKPLDISTQKNKGEFLICMDNIDNTLEIRLDFIQTYTLINKKSS